MAFSGLARCKRPAVILAACAGCYGRKNNPGKFPRAFYFDILSNSIMIASGSSNSKIINIFFPPLPNKIMIDQIPENSSGRENGQRGGDIE